MPLHVKSIILPSEMLHPGFVPLATDTFISSREPFDLWFKEQLLALTGVDLNAGPPPNEMFAETVLEYEAKGACTAFTLRMESHATTNVDKWQA